MKNIFNKNLLTKEKDDLNKIKKVGLFSFLIGTLVSGGLLPDSHPALANNDIKDNNSDSFLLQSDQSKLMETFQNSHKLAMADDGIVYMASHASHASHGSHASHASHASSSYVPSYTPSYTPPVYVAPVYVAPTVPVKSTPASSSSSTKTIESSVIVKKINYAVSDKSNLNIREKNSQKSSIIGTMKKNVKYELVDLSNKDWAKIKFNNKTGWVLKTYIKVVN